METADRNNVQEVEELFFVPESDLGLKGVQPVDPLTQKIEEAKTQITEKDLIQAINSKVNHRMSVESSTSSVWVNGRFPRIINKETDENTVFQNDDMNALLLEHFKRFKLDDFKFFDEYYELLNGYTELFLDFGSSIDRRMTRENKKLLQEKVDCYFEEVFGKATNESMYSKATEKYNIIQEYFKLKNKNENVENFYVGQDLFGEYKHFDMFLGQSEEQFHDWVHRLKKHIDAFLSSLNDSDFVNISFSLTAPEVYDDFLKLFALGLAESFKTFQPTIIRVFLAEGAKSISPHQFLQLNGHEFSMITRMKTPNFKIVFDQANHGFVPIKYYSGILLKEGDSFYVIDPFTKNDFKILDIKSLAQWKQDIHFETGNPQGDENFGVILETLDLPSLKMNLTLKESLFTGVARSIVDLSWFPTSTGLSKDDENLFWFK